MRIRGLREARLVQLGEFLVKWIEVVYWALWARHQYRQAPPWTRLALWYVPTTFGTLLVFPPPPTVPPVAIPIVAAASFCTAYTLATLTRIRI